MELADRAQSPITQNIATQALGLACLLTGDARQALELLEDSWEFRTTRGTGLYAGACETADLAAALLETGQPERAAERLEQARAYLSLGCGLRATRFHLVEARLLRETEGRRARDAIEEILSRAEAGARERSALAWLPFLKEERARMARLMGDEADAARLLRDARQQFADQGSTGHARRLAHELSGTGS
jgi:hypothetical protein